MKWIQSSATTSSLLSERQLHLKIEQRILAEHRRHPAADARPDLRPRRSTRTPRTRRAHHDPGGLELGHIGQELECLDRGPSEGMVELPGFHHGSEPCAFSCGLLYRL